MSHKPLAPETLRVVAQRFKILSEPARLEVLNMLRKGPLNVSELIEATGLNQANLSKHLQILHAGGFVMRHSVFTLCDLMCGQLKRHATAQVKQLRMVR